MGKNRSNAKDGSRSALVIDNEQDIVNLIKQSLVDGFHVCIFTDVFAALEHFKSNSRAYLIVISDIRMPGIKCYEFVKQVKKIKPQVKIMLMNAFEIET